MRVITLESTPSEAICDAFDRAFSDYLMPSPPSAGFLPEMMRRRGVEPALSVGVVDDGALVGFTLNALGTWQGALTGYDCGTGVAPSHRGRRLAGAMLARTMELVGAAGATRYLLEVLQQNERALRVYRSAGFTTTRELRCWTLDGLTRPPPDLAVVEEPAYDPAAMTPMRDHAPSWQNDDASIARAGAPKVVLAVHDAAGLAGCAVVFPASNDLAQLAVAHRARRGGVGCALLAAARARCAGPLRILNVDAADLGANAFLAATGAIESVRQFEMIAAVR